MKADTWPWVGVAPGDIPFPTQIRYVPSITPDFQNPDLWRGCQWLGLLVGTKSRKGRNDSQRAMVGGGKEEPSIAPDSFSSLTNSVTPNSSTADQTPHPRLCLDFSRLESPFSQWAGAQAQRENCSPLAKQMLGSCFPFCFLSPTNLSTTLVAERRWEGDTWDPDTGIQHGTQIAFHLRLGRMSQPYPTTLFAFPTAGRGP